MVVSDLNIICLNQKNAEYSVNERIKCDAVDINIKTPVTYSGWSILQGFKGIWYDVYPKDRIAENYQYDNEFFDIVCIKDTYIDTLNELDTEGVEPMSHSFPIKNVMREDEVRPSTDRELILSNAPKQKDGCFMVPRTVE